MCSIENMVEFDECEAAQLFFDVVESVGVQKAAHQQPNPHAFFELDVKWNLGAVDNS